jgi:hypothetical protein
MSRTYKHNKYRNWTECNIPSWFRKMYRQRDRAKQNNALREGKDIPVIKKDMSEYW